VEYVHATLHAALEQAVKWRMIPFNPAASVEPPRPVRDEQAALMTPGDARRFLKEAQKSQIYELLVLAIHTGMRRGELLALRWADIDWKSGAIRIRRSFGRVKGQAYFKEVKERDQKAVVVGGNIVALLRELRACTPHELVFCRTDGSPLDPDTVSDWAAEIAKEAGFPDLTLHGLRHTNATLLRAAGVDEKMIQKRLGHHSLKVTRDYTHVDLAMQRKVAKTLDRIIPVGHQKGTNLAQTGNSAKKSKPAIH
jgi:integrase